MSRSDAGPREISQRDRAAYRAAESIHGSGCVLQALGLSIVPLLLMLAWDMARRDDSAFVASAIFAGVLGGVLFVVGVALRSQGQIIRAVLDVAVNTAKLVSMEEERMRKEGARLEGAAGDLDEGA